MYYYALIGIYAVVFSLWLSYREDKKRAARRTDAQYADVVAGMKGEREYIDEGLHKVYSTTLQDKLALTDEFTVKIDDLEQKGAEMRTDHQQLRQRFNRFLGEFKKWSTLLLPIALERGFDDVGYHKYKSMATYLDNEEYSV